MIHEQKNLSLTNIRNKVTIDSNERSNMSLNIHKTSIFVLIHIYSCTLKYL